ncbi:hypothetical protein RB620_12245 [Paenibacillus sp. LHD-117]|uniref:hypothetical protein n=1 Tax=Paenibacillus sp. LHD-117 TaxID=3071412 RepID=UPI0027DF183B|nr:hypothetical protein [Paenibacillus sp. LHD-117]MDQ6420207.1 hypothetical protein [Paenibacillus sp. LHD-117]
MKDIAIYIAAIGAFSGVSGVVLGWIGRARSVNQDIKDEVRRDARINAEMEYLKRGFEEVKLLQHSNEKRYDALSERITRLEEFAKSVSYRIDLMDKREAR